MLNWLKLDNKSDRLKFPESAWKFVAYSVLWSFTFHTLIISGKYDYFSNPFDVWDGKNLVDDAIYLFK